MICDVFLVCFIGVNGMGKINLFDVVYYFCMGKSYFNVFDNFIVNYDSDFFCLEG